MATAQLHSVKDVWPDAELISIDELPKDDVPF